MRRLWIADVHANLPALEAVLDDAGAVDEIVFLGDFVGYGPFPSESVDRLRGMCVRAIQGNHDKSVLDLRGTQEPQANSAHAIWEHWTLQRLNEDQLDYLGSLPETLTVDLGSAPATIVHGTLPGGYLHPAMPDKVFSESFAGTPGSTVVFGHSHRLIDRQIGGTRFMCLRAVGQPRDGDPTAGYSIEVDGEFEHRRVPYDVERTVRAVQAVGLPEPFLSRWLAFLRTGRDSGWHPEYE
ncbi:MAG: metallophosphoesterase family protein [bacterium]|nr:metallophosphoesterase family protein [bacterium]